MALQVAELALAELARINRIGQQNSKMCGIFLIITTGQTNFPSEIFDQINIRKFLQRRGPDHFHCEDFIYGPFVFHLESSVLHLRGPNGSGQQPCRSINGSLLQWNGQIFRLVNDTDEEELPELPEYSSDTELLAELLNDASPNKIINIISSIHGPWSMTFWDNKRKQLWVGRDLIGRRSLCWNTNKRDQFMIITSIIGHSGPSTDSSLNLSCIEFEEIPTDAIFRFDFGQNSLINAWNERRRFYWPKSLTGFPKASNHHSDSKITKCSIQNQFNDDLPSVHTDELLKKTLDQQPFEIPEEICHRFEQVLQESVQIRCENHQNKCQDCFSNLPETEQCSHACVAVLFSGGLDSTVLALLAHKVIKPVTRPIDLLNVAFTDNAPDRSTGLDAWRELMELVPERPWNFVKINVSSTELKTFRENHVRFLVQPNATVMDDSIGCSLWWAAKGQGWRESQKNHRSESYKTPARIVLLGMGADEQLGGYSRHRQTFKSGGWSKLIQEIRMDIDRISCRNLGRDDRIIADHGVEARFPYLDEIVINFLNSLPIWLKFNPYLPRGHGEKWLLRMVARRLGLKQASQNWKRAIQFGSKITKYQSTGAVGQDPMNYD